MTRLSFPLVALLAACLAIVGTVPAAAQVSVDLHALDKLPDTKPPRPDAGAATPSDQPDAASRRTTRPAHAERQHRTHARSEHPDAHAKGHHPSQADSHGKPAAPSAHAATPAPAASASAPVHPPPAATLPTAAPPPVQLPPVPAPPVAHAAPPAPPIAADAGGDALPTADGLRVTFQPNRFDLSPDTSEALKHFAAEVPRSDDVTLDVRAYAAALPDDPSAARRLSLSRSLTIRAALMAEGFASNRIFLRALGANAGSGPADRCDIMISRLGAEPPPPGREPNTVAGQPTPGSTAAAAVAPGPPAEAGAAPIARP